MPQYLKALFRSSITALAGWQAGSMVVQEALAKSRIIGPRTALAVGLVVFTGLVLVAITVRLRGIPWETRHGQTVRVTRINAPTAFGIASFAAVFVARASFGLSAQLLLGPPTLGLQPNRNVAVLSMPLLNIGDYPTSVQRVFVDVQTGSGGACSLMPGAVDGSVGFALVDSVEIAAFGRNTLQATVPAYSLLDSVQPLQRATLQIEVTQRSDCPRSRIQLAVPVSVVVGARQGVLLQLRVPTVLRMTESDSSLRRRREHLRVLRADTTRFRSYGQSLSSRYLDSTAVTNMVTWLTETEPRFRWGGSTVVLLSVETNRGVSPSVTLAEKWY